MERLTSGQAFRFFVDIGGLDTTGKVVHNWTGAIWLIASALGEEMDNGTV